MIGLLLLASASADLDTLGGAVASCDRKVVNPAFSAEAGRRSDFMRSAFREQEAIVLARRQMAQRRQELQAVPTSTAAAEASKLSLDEAALDDRQRALNDQRLLEGLRQETMDAMRRQFLQTCPAGKQNN